MERLKFPLVLLGAYILTSLVVPMIFEGTTIFLFDSAVWVTAIVLCFLSLKKSQFRLLKSDKEITTLAIVMAFSQILFPILAGLFLGFAWNSVVWDLMSATVFLLYLLASLFAIELARFCMAKKMIKKNDQTLSLLLISLLCTIVSIPSYLGLASVPDILLFFLQKFIPMLAISLLATCFAFYGGFRASLAYMLVPSLFSWFSPIVPSLPWAMQTLMTIVLCTTGVVILDHSTRSVKDRRISGMFERKFHLLSWTGIALVGLIIVWGSSGLLGVKPTIIESGSMQPNLNVGDVTIIVPLAPDTIRIGDIIQYHTSETVIVHRVIAKDMQNGQLLFTTKGDANNAPDAEPVNEHQVMGKAVLTIPKIGWVSIALKTAISTVASFLQNNFAVAYALIGLASVYSAFRIHKYRNQSLNKLKRRLRR
jgi:signal peptidase